MILLLGNSDDVLMATVGRLMNARGLATQTLSEAYLFSTMPFAFKQCGRVRTGSLWLNGCETRLDDVSGLFLRLPSTWAPSPEFDLQDQVFVYHECRAAWFALIAELRCPIVNRPALSGWVQDPSYEETLVHGLAQRLALSVAASPGPRSSLGRTSPTRPPISPHSTSFYVVDGDLIPRLEGDETLAPRLARAGLCEWQQQNDLRFCRLDFENRDHVYKLAHVEAYPLLEEEAGGVIDRVAAAITEGLT